MKPLVLLIDDNRRAMAYYVKALRTEGFEVEQRCNAEMAVEFLKGESAERIEVVILDIMIPPGDLYSDEDSREGLQTGLLLYQDVKDALADVPILVLSNIDDPEFLRSWYDAGIEVLQKSHCAPFMLVGKVREAISGRQSDEQIG